MSKTYSTKFSDIERKWHLVDVKDAILGRTSTKIAELLLGKRKPYYVPHLDCGDYVVVINAKGVKVTGKKEKDKVYTSYSGYPGGLKKTSLEKLRQENPEEIIRHAVAGMLPHTKVQKKIMQRLYIFSGESHNFVDRFPAHQGAKK